MKRQIQTTRIPERWWSLLTTKNKASRGSWVSRYCREGFRLHSSNKNLTSPDEVNDEEYLLLNQNIDAMSPCMGLVTTQPDPRLLDLLDDSLAFSNIL